MSKTTKVVAGSGEKKNDALRYVKLAINYIKQAELKGSKEIPLKLLQAIQKRVLGVKKVSPKSELSEAKFSDAATLTLPSSLLQQPTILVQSLVEAALNTININEDLKLPHIEAITSAFNKQPEASKNTPADLDSLALDVISEENRKDGVTMSMPAAQKDPNATEQVEESPLFVDVKFKEKFESLNYPKMKEPLLIYKPIVEELENAISSQRKDDIAMLLTKTMNSFYYLLAIHPQKKLKRSRTETQNDFNRKVREKVQDDVKALIVNYLNLHEDGDTSKLVIFREALALIRNESLYKQIHDLAKNITRKINDKTVNSDLAEYRKGELEKTRSKRNVAKIASAVNQNAGVLGITDKTEGKSGGLLRIGGNASDIKENTKYKKLDFNLDFLDTFLSVYGIQVNKLKENLVDALDQAISSGATDLSSSLSENLTQVLDLAYERYSSPEEGYQKNEAQELVSSLSFLFSDRILNEKVKEMGIELNSTQFFMSQVFTKYFALNDNSEKRNFFLNIIRRLEKDHGELDGVTDLVGKLGSFKAKTEDREASRHLEFRKGKLESSRAAMTKYARESGEWVDEDLALNYLKGQTAIDFLKRFAKFQDIEKLDLMAYDLPEYKIGFVSLLAGFDPLMDLDKDTKFYGSAVPFSGLPGHGGVGLVSKAKLKSGISSFVKKKMMIALHPDQREDFIEKNFPGADKETMNNLFDKLYDFLSTREDLLEYGSGYKAKLEPEIILDISRSLDQAFQAVTKHKKDQEVTISKAREEKLETAAQASQKLLEKLGDMEANQAVLKEIVKTMLQYMMDASGKVKMSDLQDLYERLDSGSVDTKTIAASVKGDTKF